MGKYSGLHMVEYTDIAGFKKHFLICLKGVGGCKINKNRLRYLDLSKMDVLVKTVTV